jgi:hypothetical protein
MNNIEKKQAPGITVTILSFFNTFPHLLRFFSDKILPDKKASYT